ncbi:hypothetical protein UY3_07454 [Chelonia mydas]|uniref:Uncharacterized protein n=1 Tax=Chelonia mydas TaxID=8469 RepID=M7BIK2_CHEMY|nr:hypothetical protein UY3_07454 [Chelonia mydas]
MRENVMERDLKRKIQGPDPVPLVTFPLISMAAGAGLWSTWLLALQCPGRKPVLLKPKVSDVGGAEAEPDSLRLVDLHLSAFAHDRIRALLEDLQTMTSLATSIHLQIVGLALGNEKPIRLHLKMKKWSKELKKSHSRSRCNKSTAERSPIDSSTPPEREAEAELMGERQLSTYHSEDTTVSRSKFVNFSYVTIPALCSVDQA